MKLQKVLLLVRVLFYLWVYLLGASTKIVDRETGEIHMGKVPPYSVVVPGTLPSKKNDNNFKSISLLRCNCKES